LTACDIPSLGHNEFDTDFMTRRKFAALGFVACLLALALLFHRFLPLEAIVAEELRLRDAIKQNPIPMWFVGFALYIVASLIPGTGGKAMICGWLFGVWPAVLMVDGALTVAALLTFSVSRFVLRDNVESRFRSNIARINRGLEREGPYYLLLLRLIHVPYTFVNYACGATRVDVRTFWWTTHLGLLPGTLAFVFAGTRVPSLSELIGNGPLSLLDPWLIAGLALSALLPVLIRFSVLRLRRGAPDAPGAESALQQEAKQG
jgi:uncharacterized membrane protein YdjX (TVP38/TMEM64 family)